MSLEAVGLRLFRSLREAIPYSPDASGHLWVVVEDAAEFQEWMASLPGKWNLRNRDKIAISNAVNGSINRTEEQGENDTRGLGLLDEEAAGEIVNEAVLNSSTQVSNAAGRAAQRAEKLTAERLIWRHRYECDHAGRPQNKPARTDVSPSKKRRRNPSIKVGCSAKFVACRPIGEDRIYIKFSHRHTGHDVSSIKSMAESRLPKRVRDWIRSRVYEGRDWKAIRNLLRLEEHDLNKLELHTGHPDAIPEALRIRRMDVYNEIRRQLLGVARKANDRLSSIKKMGGGGGGGRGNSSCKN
ncbi:unnamed protein product [Tilletia controversa]|uniref:FAR1 domain-containing protein n=1 Tax=Tilletia controversa TaxID=13291 RepID=A0A8X7MUH4_9BASI|nr:hypothetical protein CF336_g4830 [Tilletia laevis]KAE8194056.1 hypothetical protein CF328_g4871 [Tilletia controversa]KAE8248193.1 hypothetical protein A4X06_0g3894 [Tilletia controversa]CAD6931001.1 unnamed protein product [Tilletia controversa]CAD6952453.1 unnamed protein product [Tilletia controversa]